jgi:hypothetical protein
MSFETKTAGDDVDSRCLKCKAVTNHTIIAMTGGKIAKVECNSCRTRHNYRPPVTEKKPADSTLRRRDGIVTMSNASSAKGSKSKAPRTMISRGAAKFDALAAKKDISAAINYSIDATLSAGDLLNHPIFGLGVVIAIMPPNKAQVNFREHGAKLLACKL